ncbi:hypothetical protein BMR06_15700, partial [Methylococcaceae bacterium HT5]
LQEVISCTFLSQYKGYQQALAAQKNLSGLQVKDIVLQAKDIIVICSDGVLGAQNEQPLSAPDGMIVSRRRREICQSEVRDSARGRLKFYPE